MRSSFSPLPKSPLVDTNLLFDYLVWRFWTQASPPGAEPMPRRLSTPDLKEAFRWYFDLAKPIQTSPHVIAEIQGLAKSRLGWYGEKLASFWRFAQRELARLRLQEDLIRIVEMDTDDLPTFGPTDTSLLALAARFDGLVLTDDGDLTRRCDEKQIRVWGSSEILAEWQTRVA
jgi:rRNA-processing protein FCF1